MSYTIKLRKYDAEKDEYLQLGAECFGEAIVCNGHVALRETREIVINDAPGQCWGEYIHAEAGSYRADEGRSLERDEHYCIDDAGAVVELISLDSLEPFKLSYCRYIGTAPLRYGEKPEKQHYKDIAELRWRFIAGESRSSIEISGVENGRENILIPAYIDGRKVKKADLMGCDMSSCRTLIVDSQIEELAVSFENAPYLSRIEIADSTALVCGATAVNKTPWFRAQPKGQVYLAGWYCGSRGGGQFGESALRLREGCVGVAGGADHLSYWKKIFFPSSVRRIGSRAFSCMPCLEEINFSEGIETIGEEVFWNCPRVEQLYLPDSLAKIGNFSFDLFVSLKRASMLRRCYSNRDYFLAYCDEIVIRDKAKGSKMNIKKRVWPAAPVNGRLTAYPKGRTLYVNGRSYRSPRLLTAEKTGEPHSLDYLDIYGNKVRFLDLYDTQLSTSGKGLYYNEKRWYVQDAMGITEIRRVDGDKVFMVHENLSFEDVHPDYHKYVSDIFGVVASYEA